MLKVRIASTILLVGFMSLSFNLVRAQTPQQIAQTLFPRTLVLVLEGSDGRPVSLGSGFVIGPGTVATNRHVIEGAVKGFAKYVGTRQRLEIGGVLAEDTDHDLALLRIPGVRALPVQVADSDAVQIGDTVYVIGSPVGLEGTFSNGIVSGFRALGGLRLIQITAPISPGSSGGPVANSKGAVIGIAVATLKDGQNLNFAIPVNYLMRLSATASTVRPLALRKKDPTKPRSIGAPLTEGVLAHSFSWSNSYNGDFSLSLVNQLRDPITDVKCLVIFYNAQGLPLSVSEVGMSGHTPIAPGLAVRVYGTTTQDVKGLVGYFVRDNKGHQRIETRILGFRVMAN